MFSIIGLIVCVLLCVKALYHVFQVFTRKSFVWIIDNQWAVVTGATDGIGYEFARQLAHKGFNLMLISRNEQKLAETRQKILDDLFDDQSESRNIQIRTHAADFTRLDIYDEIDTFLDPSGHELFVLVNNVGMSSPIPDNFLGNGQESRSLNANMINVNIIGTTRMTELVLPSMVRNGRGLVVNMSSFVSKHVTPMLSTYSATKAYISQLSQCLAAEYESSGITFATFTTGVVSTKMAHNVTTNLMVPSAEQYVRGCLAQIIYRQSLFCTGNWMHSLLDRLLSAMSSLFSTHLVAKWILWFLTISKRKLLEVQSMQNKPQVSMSMFRDKNMPINSI